MDSDVLWMMPDVGEVLGDSSLAEPDTGVDVRRPGRLSYLAIHKTAPIKGTEEGGGELDPRVLHLIRRGSSSFMALSPPPAYLFIVDPNRVHEQSLQHWLSFPALSYLALAHPDAGRLLQLLPAVFSHKYGVRQLDLHFQDEEIVDALMGEPSACSALPHVSLVCYGSLSDRASDPESAICKLAKKCRSLTLVPQSYAAVLLAFITDDCKLQVLRFRSYRQRQSQFFVDDVNVLKKIESCQLKRLDMRQLPPLGPEAMTSLVASLASPACSIQDLGISLASTPHWHHTRLLILAHAFQFGSSLSNLKVLRFSDVNTPEAAACVVDILSSPESNCKVRFLDIQIHEYDDYKPFFKRLQDLARPVRIECLRIQGLLKSAYHEIKPEIDSMSDFLASEHCSLLWLDCSLSEFLLSYIPEAVQMKLANSLEANFLITSLRIRGMESRAARSRASAFITRNCLYKAMGLSKDDFMKPQVARLFLCGNGEVGKTTLRRALLKLNRSQQPISTSPQHLSSSSGADPSCSTSNMYCFQACRSTSPLGVEPRTRGLEIHHLSFGPHQKLAIFDLGGQVDYHIFHHFFVANTSHDLFLIVCKYSDHMALELEYWLRFIVSHRNSVNGPNTRIMLVVNFFDTTTGKLENMKGIACSFTKKLQEKYVEHLDFGARAHDCVFGIVAIHTSQARPVLEKLKVLLAELLEQRPLIPKICHDLLSHTLPLISMRKKQLTSAFGWGLPECAARQGKKANLQKVIVDFEEVKEHYVQQQDEVHRTVSEVRKIEKRMQAALQELQNIGEAIYFPPVGVPKQAKASRPNTVGQNMQSELREGNAIISLPEEAGKTLSPIIVNPNWFCNQIVGNLLAPESLLGKQKWTKNQIMHTLIRNGCATQYVDEMLRYILNLDLCYCFHNEFFFPAVASEKNLHWPPDFKIHRSNGGSMHFYGRRIQCMESERHLIPSGVFARLQVKLENLCGEGEQGYKFGYHWASFVHGTISVMVRFGEVASKTTYDNHYNTLPIEMKEDNHPLWIDILLCCPSSQDSPPSGTSAEYNIMQQIKELIFGICQATSRGIPTVVLEECALRHEVAQDVMQLKLINACIRKNGLASNVVWGTDQQRIGAVSLLLPEELQDHVLSHIQAIQQIQEEFSSKFLHTNEQVEDLPVDEANIKGGEGDQISSSQLHGELKVLYDLINQDIKSLHAEMQNVVTLVREIKQDVQKVMKDLQQAEINIVAKCSTGLLEQLLIQGAFPAYFYLTDSNGIMQRLKNFIAGRKATVHFLCESMQGPHKVEGQVGREVVVEKGILMKWAPFLIPALMVACCAASLASNASLPGIAPMFFNPLLHFLSSIGISKDDLTSQVTPQALKALFHELDVKIQGLYDQKTHSININEAQQKEGKEALQKVLGSIQDLDMEKDFGLFLVRVGKRAQWLCEQHARPYDRLERQRKNPFQF